MLLYQWQCNYQRVQEIDNTCFNNQRALEVTGGHKQRGQSLICGPLTQVFEFHSHDRACNQLITLTLNVRAIGSGSVITESFAAITNLVIIIMTAVTPH